MKITQTVTVSTHNLVGDHFEGVEGKNWQDACDSHDHQAAESSIHDLSV